MWRAWRSGLALLLCALPLQAAERLTLAVASNFRPPMEMLIAEFKRQHADVALEAAYASSAKLSTQIRQGAPFDAFLSADTAYAQSLQDDGFTAGPLLMVGRGRIVLWSANQDVQGMSLSDLDAPGMRKIAIANPDTAPYGERAMQALRASGVWDRVSSRLVYGENIAQAAQFVLSGNADVGIIALSQALLPELAQRGAYAPIDDALYAPLEQVMVLTQRGKRNASAQSFMKFIAGAHARQIIAQHGYAPSLAQGPGE